MAIENTFEQPVSRLSMPLPSGLLRLLGRCCGVMLGFAFVTLAYADDITYGYDALGRLTSVSVSGATAYYDYDAAGNITAIRRQGGVASAVPVSGTGSPPAADAVNWALSSIPTQLSARQVRGA
ncbi:RHS repeat domain-containing protein [Paraburkholderia fungorum]|uniref:RHS repeat domain-containing protein n=1 Tax=Paraburkholderia fungorum TaxID=134537 RepID=UPI00209291F1|nr:RHS repeat domain-containing protein [Paraburkholderia fungorum]USU16831.1 YD repeat-containing protein [Paraburkholderia fungorum]USU24776.1 YD repeat-containing protein [Paraburkholderia fungorum]